MVTKMFDIGIKRVAAIVTGYIFLGFANLFRFKTAGFSKLQMNLKIKYFRIVSLFIFYLAV